MGRAVQKEEGRYKNIKRVNVTGLSHHNYAMFAKQIEVGDELVMERDVTNRFDQNAIRLLWNGEQIGWVPKEQNDVIAKLMDANLDVRCAVISHDRDVGDLQRRLYVGIFIRVAE